MDTPVNREFLGIGWRFPLQVGADGRIAKARYEQRVEESIVLILSTRFADHRSQGFCNAVSNR